MKKLVSAVTALTLSAALLAGCGPKAPAPTTAPTEAPAASTLKTGLSVVGSQSKSKDATAEKAGAFQTDVTMVAVNVDENGVIVDCVIDTVQAKADFDATGAYTFPENIKSKIELGDDYGMRGVSSIGAEWFEQAAALIDYVTGKTVEEVKGIALDDATVTTEADLLAGCTMKIGGYIDGIVAAAESAADLGAKAGDKLSLAATSSVKAGKKDGEAQANVNVSAVTMDAEGRLTSAVIDVLQSKFAVDANGVITSDTTAVLPSKNTLGDDYGMRDASSISAEWNEQAAAFAAYVNGKTADEILGLAVTEDGKSSDADLLAGCTLPLASFQPVVAKAMGVTAGGLKTGLSVVGDQHFSKDASADKDGAFQTDVNMVAVVVDGNGVIVDCVIDVVQAKATFDATGAYTFPEEILSKVELGDGYGMRDVSSIGAEWFEQAAALSEYVIGKTVEEVKGIALDDATVTTDADLLAGCTMKIGGYINGIVAAAESATELGAQAGDKLSLAATSSVKAGKGEGEAQANINVSAVTTDAEGRLTSCVIDVLQSKCAVDASGVITSDTTATLSSKNTLGDDYGMRGASSISAEWNEQAAAFAAYVNGKTADEINGLAVGEDGKSTEADLLAGCTLPLGSFQPVVTKAMG